MRKFTFILALFFLPIVFNSCNTPFLASTETVIFILPDPPSDFTYWNIITRCSNESRSFKTSENTVKLTLNKNEPYSILAYPITSLKNGNPVSFYKPAGIIYPYTYNADNSTQNLTWEGGVSAAIFNKLVEEGINQQLSSSQINNFIQSFNWQKLISLISQKSEQSFEKIITNKEEKFYNPWQIDFTRLLENLSNHNFNSSYLDLTYQFTIPANTISTSLESSYIPQNIILKKNNTITLKKDIPELLLYKNLYGAYVTGSSAKNISLQLIYMPIIEEEL